jgi:hypothetical protein
MSACDWQACSASSLWDWIFSLAAQPTTAAGEFIVEPPTLVSLGFEWRISGDDNRNAQVEVTYRQKGEAGWRDALPLLRL